MRKKLDIGSLQVTSFATASRAIASTGSDTWDEACKCCTGCDSGCGIIPTGGGCVSAGGDTEAPVC